MPITPLQTLDATGEVNYVPKHNANYAAIESAINTLLDRTATLPTTTNALALDAMFGEATAFIGAQSYFATQAGTTLEISEGYAYRISSHTAVHHAGGTTIDFAGNAAGTYYVKVSADGMPAFSVSATDALWEVVWLGSAFDSVTRYAPIVWGEVDFTLAQTSAALADTFDRLVDRLEAAETACQAMLAITITTADVTPAPAEIMQAQFFRLNGALTGNRNLIVPDSEKFLVVKNECTGAYTVTVKTAAGTGIALVAGQTAHLYVDGTNVRSVDPAAAKFREGYWPGALTAGEVAHRTKMGEAESVPADFAGSKFSLDSPPSDGDWVVSFRKNSIEFGTVTFVTGSTTPVPSSTLTALPVDDLFDVIFPAVADGGAAGFYMNLRTNRS
jgi:hypothetical protein